MYAIVQQGGHQYRVAPGDRLVVDQLSAEVGSVVALEPVLLVQDDDGATVGQPTVEGMRVAAVVVAHDRGRKLRVFKYKPKKRFRRTQGHRSHLTELRVEAVLAAGEPLPEAPPKAAATIDAAPDEEATEAPAPRRRARAHSAEAEVPAVEAEAEEAPAAEATPRRRPRAVAKVEAESAETADTEPAAEPAEDETEA